MRLFSTSNSYSFARVNEQFAQLNVNSHSQKFALWLKYRYKSNRFWITLWPKAHASLAYLHWNFHITFQCKTKTKIISKRKNDAATAAITAAVTRSRRFYFLYLAESVRARDRSFRIAISIGPQYIYIYVCIYIKSLNSTVLPLTSSLASMCKWLEANSTWKLIYSFWPHILP